MHVMLRCSRQKETLQRMWFMTKGKLRPDCGLQSGKAARREMPHIFRAHIPLVENTKGVKAPCSTSLILARKWCFFSHSFAASWVMILHDDAEAMPSVGHETR